VDEVVLRVWIGRPATSAFVAFGPLIRSVQRVRQLRHLCRRARILHHLPNGTAIAASDPKRAWIIQ
jgi:hypothetical protein